MCASAQVFEVDRQVSRMDSLSMGHTKRSVSSIPFWLLADDVQGLRIILLHDLKQDDSIRLFLHAIWEAYTKHLLNPFHELNAPIRSVAFDNRVKAAAKQHL